MDDQGERTTERLTRHIQFHGIFDRTVMVPLALVSWSDSSCDRRNVAEARKGWIERMAGIAPSLLRQA